MTIRRLLRSRRALAFFYRRYLITAVIVDLGCLSLFVQGGADLLPTMFWLKVITDLLIVLFENQRSAKTFYYYFNLGLPKAVLWGATLAADFVIFLLMIVIAAQVR